MKRVKQIVQYWCDDVIKGKYLGKGVVAVVLDTGIAPHPDFQNKVLAFRDFVNGQEVIYDDNGHLFFIVHNCTILYYHTFFKIAMLFSRFSVNTTDCVGRLLTLFST